MLTEVAEFFSPFISCKSGTSIGDKLAQNAIVQNKILGINGVFILNIIQKEIQI